MITQLLAPLRVITKLWQRWHNHEPWGSLPGGVPRTIYDQPPVVEIAVTDPLYSYLVKNRGVLMLEGLSFDSPALQQLKRAEIKIAVPLVSQGELIGVIYLGARRSQQDYSAEDRGLLNILAAQASPALHFAQVAREQKLAALEHQRLEQELRVARLVQQTLLPKVPPSLQGWRISEYYRPARFVGGDFYDFLPLNGGHLGIVIGDVADKGVPAALLMASIRSVLRSVALQETSPAQVLQRVNNVLCPDMPANMFITCLYAVLDPLSGHLCFSNAGHALPYYCARNGVSALRISGMPLGIIAGMTYEEQEMYIDYGERIVFYSDGLVEAHNREGEIFGFPRLIELLAQAHAEASVVLFLLGQLQEFTGSDWEQEDDITLVELFRAEDMASLTNTERGLDMQHAVDEPLRSIIADFTIPSIPGNERLAVEHVMRAISGFPVNKSLQERLKTAIAEATMNAMEHGNHFQAEKLVAIDVLSDQSKLVIRIKDFGTGYSLSEIEDPSLEAKLTGKQSERGWGLLLIKNLADDVFIFNDGMYCICELTFHLVGDIDTDEKF